LDARSQVSGSVSKVTAAAPAAESPGPREADAWSLIREKYREELFRRWNRDGGAAAFVFLLDRLASREWEADKLREALAERGGVSKAEEATVSR
jgi:hypothetical protein